MHSIHPFTDFLKLTVPAGEAPFLWDALEGVIVESGASESQPGLFRLGGHGVVKFGEWGKVGTLSVTGDALGELRKHGTFLPFLGEIGACPHRVTRLDAALDVEQDAGPVVARIYRRAAGGGFKLTRKAIQKSRITRLQRVGHADGRPTGTVYLGSRTSDVHARVYDKRNQLLDQAIEQHGSHPSVIELNDPGPLTRYEITFGRKVGATLRDVADPAALFWAYAGDLLRRPAGVPEWSPHAEGYELPRHEPNPVLQLSLLLDASPDIKRAAKLSHAIGGADPVEVIARLKSYLIQGRVLPAGRPVRA